MRPNARIYVAGGDTRIGAALLRCLRSEGHYDLRGLPGAAPALERSEEVDDFFARERPEYVIVAAGASGGIAANQRRPAELMRDNLVKILNILHAAHHHHTTRLLYLGSSCCYPRDCPQPMREADLMTSPLEPTSSAYATAKLAGMELCRAYRRQYGNDFAIGIPADIFGPDDPFGSPDAHVVASLFHRMHQAKVEGFESVTIWGSGRPRRDFLFADDLADACLEVLFRYDGEEPINLTAGRDVSIAELAELIRGVVGFDGALEFDSTRPDGAPRKALDGSRLAALGWQARTPLREALVTTYRAWQNAQPRMAHA